MGGCFLERIFLIKEYIILKYLDLKVCFIERIFLIKDSFILKYLDLKGCFIKRIFLIKEYFNLQIFRFKLYILLNLIIPSITLWEQKILKNIQKYVQFFLRKILKKILSKCLGIVADNYNLLGCLISILPDNLNILSHLIENINCIPSISIHIGELNINIGLFTFISFLSLFKLLFLNIWKLVKPFINAPKYLLTAIGVVYVPQAPKPRLTTDDDLLFAFHHYSGGAGLHGNPMLPNPANTSEAVKTARIVNYHTALYNRILQNWTVHRQIREFCDKDVPGRP